MDFKTALREYVKESFATAVNDSFVMYAHLTDRCADRDEYEKVLYFYRIDSVMHIFKVLNESGEAGVELLKSRYKEYNKKETEAIKKHQIMMSTPDKFGGQAVFKSKPVSEKKFISIIDICYDILCPGWLDSHAQVTVPQSKTAVITKKRSPGNSKPAVKIYTNGVNDTTKDKTQLKSKKKTTNSTTKAVISEVQTGTISGGNGVGRDANIAIIDSNSGRSVAISDNNIAIASSGKGGNVAIAGNTIAFNTGSIIGGIKTNNSGTTAHVNNVMIRTKDGVVNGIINNVLRIGPGNDGTAKITVLGKSITVVGGCRVTVGKDIVKVEPVQGETTIIDISSKKIVSQNQPVTQKPVKVQNSKIHQLPVQIQPVTQKPIKVLGTKKLIIYGNDKNIFVYVSGKYKKVSARCKGLISYKSLPVNDNGNETKIIIPAGYFMPTKSAFIAVPADTYKSVVIDAFGDLNYKEKKDAGHIYSLEINSRGSTKIQTTAEESVINNNNVYNSISYINNHNGEITAKINAYEADILLPNIGEVRLQSTHGNKDLNINSNDYTVNSSGITQTKKGNKSSKLKNSAHLVVNARSISIRQK